MTLEEKKSIVWDDFFDMSAEAALSYWNEYACPDRRIYDNVDDVVDNWFWDWKDAARRSGSVLCRAADEDGYFWLDGSGKLNFANWGEGFGWQIEECVNYDSFSEWLVDQLSSKYDWDEEDEDEEDEEDEDDEDEE